MDAHHLLLISRQESLARAVIPGVMDHRDRLTTASNLFDGLAVVREDSPDVVLVALDEEDQDAAVMCRTVRRYSDLPIVMVVNSATRDQIARGYRLGADLHIEIPCDPREFRARVTAVTRRKAPAIP